MNIIVVGAGGIGGTIGAYLARGGANVHFIVRSKEAEKTINDKGIIIKGPQEKFHVHNVTAGLPDNLPSKTDLLMIGVKHIQSKESLRPLTKIKATAVVSLQNGLDKYDIMRRYFPEESGLGFLSLTVGMKIRPNRFRCSVLGRLYLGELDGTLTSRVKRIGEVCSRGGMKVEIRRDIMSVEWSKKAFWIAVSLVSVLARAYYAEVFLDEDLRMLYYEVMKEVASVAKKQGIKICNVEGFNTATVLNKPRKEALRILRQKGVSLYKTKMRNYKQLMLRDFENKQITEMEPTAGYVLDCAQRLGISIPYTESMVRIIRAVEKKFKN